MLAWLSQFPVDIGSTPHTVPRALPVRSSVSRANIADQNRPSQVLRFHKLEALQLSPVQGRRLLEHSTAIELPIRRTEYALPTADHDPRMEDVPD